MSAAERFSHSCLLSLGEILTVGSKPMLGLWIAEHVGGERAAWEDFAETLVSLSAACVQLDAFVAGMRDPSVFPKMADDTPRLAQLGMQMLVMRMNGDTAGIRGVLAAVAETNEVPELCGALAIIGHRAFTGKLVRIVP